MGEFFAGEPCAVPEICDGIQSKPILLCRLERLPVLLVSAPPEKAGVVPALNFYGFLCLFLHPLLNLVKISVHKPQNLPMVF